MKRKNKKETKIAKESKSENTNKVSNNDIIKSSIFGNKKERNKTEEITKNNHINKYTEKNNNENKKEDKNIKNNKNAFLQPTNKKNNTNNDKESVEENTKTKNEDNNNNPNILNDDNINTDIFLLDNKKEPNKNKSTKYMSLYKKNKENLPNNNEDLYNDSNDYLNDANFDNEDEYQKLKIDNFNNNNENDEDNKDNNDNNDNDVDDIDNDDQKYMHNNMNSSLLSSFLKNKNNNPIGSKSFANLMKDKTLSDIIKNKNMRMSYRENEHNNMLLMSNYYSNNLNYNTYNNSLNKNTNKTNSYNINSYNMNSYNNIDNYMNNYDNNIFKYNTNTNPSVNLNQSNLYSYASGNDNNINEINYNINTNNTNNTHVTHNLASNINNSHIIDANELIFLEGKIKNILVLISKSQTPTIELIEYWYYFYNSSLLSNFLSYFENENNKQKINYFYHIEALCYLLCFDSCINNDKFIKVSSILKNIFTYVHYNFILFCKYLLYKLETVSPKKVDEINQLKTIIKGELPSLVSFKFFDEFSLIQRMEITINKILAFYQEIIETFYSVESISEAKKRRTSFSSSTSQNIYNSNTIKKSLNFNDLKMENNNIQNFASPIVPINEEDDYGEENKNYLADKNNNNNEELNIDTIITNTNAKDKEEDNPDNMQIIINFFQKTIKNVMNYTFDDYNDFLMFYLDISNLSQFYSKNTATNCTNNSSNTNTVDIYFNPFVSMKKGRNNNNMNNINNYNNYNTNNTNNNNVINQINPNNDYHTNTYNTSTDSYNTNTNNLINNLNNYLNSNNYNNEIDSNNNSILKRTISLSNVNNSFCSNDENNNTNYISENQIYCLLPKIDSEYEYTLVLELDEVLVNVQIIKENPRPKAIVYFRPHLFKFLRKMKDIYELVLFTSTGCSYATKISQAIEKDEKFFSYKLFKNHTTKINGMNVKDLSKINRNLKRTIIVDIVASNFSLQMENGIIIKPYYGDNCGDNNVLDELGNILERIRFEGFSDVRKSLMKYRQRIRQKISAEYIEDDDEEEEEEEEDEENN